MAKRGRTLKGSIRARGRSWYASVPRLDHPTKRLEVPFPTEADAQAWIEVQIERLHQGLAPIKPEAKRSIASASSAPTPVAATARAAGTAAVMGFIAVGLAWRHERYVEFEHAGAEREAETLRDLELHVFPYLAGLFDCDLPTGRALLKDWVRAMSGRKPTTPGSPFQAASPPKARSSVTGYLWMIREILEYGRTLGFDIPGYADGKNIRAMTPRGTQKRQVPLVSIAATAAVAVHLHVIHQLVLWLMRLNGLRISEVYGLLVGSFIVDEDGDGFLIIEGQGGKNFRVRDEHGHLQTVSRVNSGKTDAAYRLVAVSSYLVTLIHWIIAAYHTAPDGTIDLTARLVPTIQSEDGGQAGFRCALAVAAKAVGAASGDPEHYWAHDFRKNFGKDLAWDDAVSARLARRAMGHRFGSDVFDMVYALDSRLKEHLVPAARATDARIAMDLDTLLVPTAKRPGYHKAIDPHDIARIDATLEAAGWQVREHDGRITVPDAAAILGMSETATRRLMGYRIPAAKGQRDQWLVIVDDVIAYRDRQRDHQFLTDVAESANVDYHTTYATMRRLKLDPTKDDYTRELLLSTAEAAAILGELDRIAQLRDRAMTVAVAAGELRAALSTVNAWARKGRLTYDPETDASGARYITRASIDAELAQRRRRAAPTINVADLRAVAGLDDAGIKALVAAKLLVRTRGSEVTLTSVRAWATGYRPDLLATTLLRDN